MSNNYPSYSGQVGSARGASGPVLSGANQAGPRDPKSLPDTPAPSIHEQPILEGLTQEADFITDRIANASIRLRALNERLHGTQPEAKDDSNGPIVVGHLSALAHRQYRQRVMLEQLETQLAIAERI